MSSGQRVNSHRKWNLGNNTISEVDSYKYLGVYISRNLSDKSHIDEVIRTTLIVYYSNLYGNLLVFISNQLRMSSVAL